MPIFTTTNSKYDEMLSHEDWAATHPGTVLFEFKAGPYSALDDKDFAPWAPTEGQADSAALVQRFVTAAIGETLAG